MTKTLKDCIIVSVGSSTGEDYEKENYCRINARDSRALLGFVRENPKQTQNAQSDRR